MLSIATVSSSSVHVAIAGGVIAANLVLSMPARNKSAPPGADTAKASKGARTSLTDNELTGGAKPIGIAPQPQPLRLTL